MKTVCFTGHRPEKLNFTENDIRFERFENLLFKIVDRLSLLGCENFISGMARGFDIWAAEAVCLLKEKKEVRLVCAVPFPEQSKSWAKSERQRWNNIISHSDDVVIIFEKYRKSCFHERNRYMVDNSHVVVCLYDGTSGGTAYTVNYALKKGKVVIQIDPNTFKVSFLGEKTLNGIDALENV